MITSFSMSPDTDVLIVGAGLAGLRCAVRLQHAGVSCRLLEASDGPGGRVRTEATGGFLLDCGFQVLLTAYPAARAAFDYAALDLQPFVPGALVRRAGRFMRVADPLRAPRSLLSTLWADVGSPVDKLKVLRLRLGLARRSPEALFERPETSTASALRARWGFSETMVDRFFRPFLGGITLDRELETSSRLFEYVMQMFTRGEAAVPARGMGALPAQLAARLDPGSVLTGVRVDALEPGRVRLDDGRTLAARAVVVATEGPEAARLTGSFAAPASRSVSTLYFAAEKAPIGEPILVLGDGGVVNHLAVISNVAASYAPAGAALIAANVLGRHDAEEPVREELVRWFGPQVRRWRHLKTYVIGHALPAQPPPALSPPRRPVRLAPGLYVCGDHRDQASLQGALASGHRTGTAILDDLGLLPSAEKHMEGDR